MFWPQYEQMTNKVYRRSTRQLVSDIPGLISFVPIGQTPLSGGRARMSEIRMNDRNGETCDGWK